MCKKDSNVLTLGLYENHFVFIKELNKLCDKYRCEHCDRIFKRSDFLLNHQKNVCDKLYVDEFTKNIEKFSHSNSIIKTILDGEARPNLSGTTQIDKNVSFQYPYFGVYDFESVAVDVDKKKGNNTIILNKQTPISYSMYSNIPNQEMIHVVNKDTNMLIKSLVDDMNKMSLRANKVMLPTYYPYIDRYLQ